MRAAALLIALMAILLSAAVTWAPAETRTRIRFAWQRSHGTVPDWLDDWAGYPVPIWYEMVPHVRMFLDPWDMGPRMILESGGYERASMGYVEEALAGRHLGYNRALKVGDRVLVDGQPTFVDVGANFGVYSLVMAAHGARVIAVEPNPEAVKRLRGNIAASRAQVQVEPVAAGDKVGTMTLYVAPGDNTGMTSLARENARGGMAAYQVSVWTLDSMLAGSRVDAMKIDVEGAELMVLRGATGTLRTWHPMLLVEIIDRQLVAMGTSEAELRAWLWNAGYREGRRDGDNVEFVWEARR